MCTINSMCTYRETLMPKDQRPTKQIKHILFCIARVAQGLVPTDTYIRMTAKQKDRTSTATCAIKY